MENKSCPHCRREFIFVGTTAFKKLNGEFGESVPIYISTCDREKAVTITEQEQSVFDKVIEEFGKYSRQHEEELRQGKEL